LAIRTLGRQARALAVLVGALASSALLAGCSSALDLTGGVQEARLEVAEAQLSPTTAAAMINAFRAQNGLGPVRINTQLNGVAQRQARAMARANQMSHGVSGPFRNRLSSSGYNARTAGENIAAGYKNFSAVLAGWQKSPPHRHTLLLRDAKEMGIAVAYAPGTRYGNFWALVVAAPF
jgi:uncharacterized protein YkwD